MEKRLFIAAAFLAAFVTGCPGPDQGIDVGPLPDTGMPVDAGPDLVDAWVDPMVDAYVPMDGGMPDTGLLDECRNPDYVGLACNLPPGMVYTRTDFICADRINWDDWLGDEVGATPGRVSSREAAGAIYSYLGSIPNGNTGLLMPATGDGIEWTCGPEGRCWLNWFNPDSNYSHCRVTFTNGSDAPGCDVAMTECWLPGSSDPVTNYAVYIGPSA
jgi:hypothetical protein